MNGKIKYFSGDYDVEYYNGYKETVYLDDWHIRHWYKNNKEVKSFNLTDEYKNKFWETTTK